MRIAMLVPLSALGTGTLAAHFACRARTACFEAARLPLAAVTCASGTDPYASQPAPRACAFIACPVHAGLNHGLLDERAPGVGVVLPMLESASSQYVGPEVVRT